MRKLMTRATGTLLSFLIAVSLAATVYATAAPMLRGPAQPQIYKASSSDTAKSAQSAARKKRKKKHHFGVAANPAPQGIGGFGPNDPRPLSFTITNPFKFAIRVTALNIQIKTAPSGCNLSWIQVQLPISPTNFVDVRRRSSLVLDAAHQPKISVDDLPTVNQDACKGGAFTYTFTSTAVKKP